VLCAAANKVKGTVKLPFSAENSVSGVINEVSVQLDSMFISLLQAQTAQRKTKRAIM